MQYKYLSKPLYQETIQLINEIYKSHSVTGGELHIVLDDGNVEDHHIQWCIDNSIKECENQEEKELYLKCANNLLKMKIKQRFEVISASYTELLNKGGAK